MARRGQALGRGRRLLVVVGVAALVFAGCGGDDEADPADDVAEQAGGDGLSGDQGGALSGDASVPPAEADDEAATPAEEPAEEAPDEGAAAEPPADEGSDPATTYAPGDPCPVGEGIPDCIDPDGDGQGTVLEGGDACVASAADIDVCLDNDGDGSVVEPDGEGRPLPGEGTDGEADTEDPGAGETSDLPLCGDGIPFPCRNPDGSVQEESSGETADLPDCGPAIEPPCVLPDGTVVEPTEGE